MTAKNFSTTPTIALFLIISVTGVFLLLHVDSPNLKAIHEWLGLIFVVCGILHAIANWKPMKRYLGGMRAAVIGLMLISVVTYSVVAAPTDKAGNPIKSVINQVMKAPISTIAILYGQKADTLVEQLQDKGYTIAGVDNTLEEIARQNNIPTEEIIALIATGQNK
jgi:hypothetical protein